MLMNANVTGPGLPQADLVTISLERYINQFSAQKFSISVSSVCTHHRPTLIADLTGGNEGGEDRGHDGAMQ